MGLNASPTARRAGASLRDHVRRPRGDRAGSFSRCFVSAGAALAASVLGFFVITLDATIVNVVLPSIRADLGGG
jgi:hypothetical protein